MKGISFRKAINQHCKDCIYDNCVPGAWRQQVEACTVPNCALYPLRPTSYAGKIESNDDNPADLVE